MAKLRHIAMVVEDIEKTAQFYEKSFEMKRVRKTPTAIGLSDGVVSLVIIDSKNANMRGDDRRGVHHIGFLVDDVDAMGKKVEANGAKYHGELRDKAKPREVGERKYQDPNGQIFDLTCVEYARDTWQVDVNV
jgi:catechol 2,3-dioxygenase-like lactoylglutathione lyase family enzyme